MAKKTDLAINGGKPAKTLGDMLVGYTSHLVSPCAA